MKVNPIYMKILAISLIPIVLILGTTIAMLFVSDVFGPQFANELRIDVGDDYATEVEENQFNEAKQFAAYLDKFYDHVGELSNFTSSFVVDQLDEQGIPLENYDSTSIKTPQREFSEKHNITMDFSVSALKVFEDDRSLALNSSINDTSRMDLILPAIYSTLDEIHSIDIAMDVGYLRTYPFYNTNTTDPRNETWYKDATSSTGAQITGPYIDENAGEILFKANFRIVQSNTFVGVVSINFFYTGYINEIQNLKARQNSRAFLFSSDRKTIAHTDMRVPAGGWDNETLYTSILDLELNDTLFDAMINDTLINSINQTLIETELYGDHLVTMVKLENADFIFGFAREYFAPEVYAEYTLFDLLFIPVLTLAIAIGINYQILKRYGFLKGVDLVELAKQDIIGDLVDKIPTSADEVMDLVTDKIHEEGEELRDKLKKKGVKTLKERAIALEASVLSKIDGVIDTTIEKLEDIEEAVVAKRDALVDDMISKGELLYSKAEDLGVDMDAIKSGDYSSVIQLADQLQKLEVMLREHQLIDVLKLAETLYEDPERIKDWLETLPPEYGIYLEGDMVQLDQEKIMEYLPDIIKTYTGKDIHGIMVDGFNLYGKLGDLGVDVDAIALGDFRSLTDLADKAQRVQVILRESEDWIDAREFASILEQDPEKIKEWVSQIPPEYGLSLSEDTIDINSDLINDTITEILKSYNDFEF